jgi:pimeloyl-ACP methyl ester carboxylesterase
VKRFDPERLPVVLVHGALRSRLGLVPTAVLLRRHGIDARPFGYPTRQGTVWDHGRRLATFLDETLGDHRPAVLGLLTHSMGALVARAYLQLCGDRHADAQRVVMLSPPNRGAALAERNVDDPWARLAYGDALDELRPHVAEALPGPPPTTSILVLAGGRGDPRGFNPKIEGDDDGVVGVAEMGLPGVDPTFIGGLHGLLQWRPAVLARAARFFATGEDA